MKVLASQIQKGDYVTYCGASFTASKVEKDEISGLLKVTVTGQIPQYIAPEREVSVVREDKSKTHPFYVYTRRYLRSGRCIKGFRRFRTRAEQGRYISTTNNAVTAHN